MLFLTIRKASSEHCCVRRRLAFPNLHSPGTLQPGGRVLMATAWLFPRTCRDKNHYHLRMDIFVLGMNSSSWPSLSTLPLMQFHCGWCYPVSQELPSLPHSENKRSGSHFMGETTLSFGIRVNERWDPTTKLFICSCLWLLSASWRMSRWPWGRA